MEIRSFSRFKTMAIGLALVVGVGAVLYYALSAPTPKKPRGMWRRIRQPAAAPHDELVAQLEAIGYLDGYEPPGKLIGVTAHAAERASPGLNLYVSGHAQGAFLMDMDGEVVHEWKLAFEDAFPEHAGRLTDEEEHRQSRRDRWRRVYLMPNGDVLAIFEGFGIVKVDRHSRLLWARANGAHHDLHVMPDGRLVVLTRKAHVVESVGPDPILEDFVVVLDAEGDELERISLVDAVQGSDWSTLLEHSDRVGDIFHTNSIEVLDGTGSERAPFLVSGHYLVSFRNLDTVAIVDPKGPAITWAMTGLWQGQHDPNVLDDGHLLVLDNLGHFGMSKVVEIDPLTQQVVWAYRGTEANGFTTSCCGTAQRLPNGNTLIVETEAGRAFEVDADGRIVWEFFNPARAGSDGELIAALFDLQRIPPGFPLDWLERGD